MTQTELKRSTDALRTHDAAQRGRIKQLEDLAAAQAEMLEVLSRFFLEEDCKGVYDKIQAQLDEYKRVVVKGESL